MPPYPRSRASSTRASGTTAALGHRVNEVHQQRESPPPHRRASVHGSGPEPGMLLRIREPPDDGLDQRVLELGGQASFNSPPAAAIRAASANRGTLPLVQVGSRRKRAHSRPRQPRAPGARPPRQRRAPPLRPARAGRGGWRTGSPRSLRQEPVRSAQASSAERPSAELSLGRAADSSAFKRAPLGPFRAPPAPHLGRVSTCLQRCGNGRRELVEFRCIQESRSGTRRASPAAPPGCAWPPSRRMMAWAVARRRSTDTGGERRGHSTLRLQGILCRISSGE